MESRCLQFKIWGESSGRFLKDNIPKGQSGIIAFAESAETAPKGNSTSLDTSILGYWFDVKVALGRFVVFLLIQIIIHQFC